MSRLQQMVNDKREQWNSNAILNGIRLMHNGERYQSYLNIHGERQWEPETHMSLMSFSEESFIAAMQSGRYNVNLPCLRFLSGHQPA